MNIPHYHLIVYTIVFIALRLNSVRAKNAKIENYGYVHTYIDTYMEINILLFVSMYSKKIVLNHTVN